jgi:hypothetical protein
MQFTIAGLLVCASLFIAGRIVGDILIFGVMASLAFGATSLVTLSAVGGSSPLIYTLFTTLLVLSVTVRRRMWRDLGLVYGSSPLFWIVTGLALYAVIGAWLFPRLFAGQATVFVQSPMRTGVIETYLSPVSGNVTQTAYFVLGALASIAVAVLLRSHPSMRTIRNGFLAWCILHTAFGAIDLLGKVAGMEDVLAFLRTANYAMLTNVEEAGFWRIAGSYSEASAFGGISLSCLAFSYTYWRRTGSAVALVITGTLAVLLLLSTSSTAYVGLAALGTFAAVSMMRRSLRSGALARPDVMLAVVSTFGLLVVMAVAVVEPARFDPFIRLIESTIINKSASASMQERTYWNLVSLGSFGQTNFMGVGLGSSRASSWLVAVVSQLGLVGIIGLAILAGGILKGLGALEHAIDRDDAAVVAAVRAAAVGSMIAGSLISGTADPGMVFFFALAVTTVARAEARMGIRAATEPVDNELGGMAGALPAGARETPQPG